MRVWWCLSPTNLPWIWTGNLKVKGPITPMLGLPVPGIIDTKNLVSLGGWTPHTAPVPCKHGPLPPPWDLMGEHSSVCVWQSCWYQSTPQTPRQIPVSSHMQRDSAKFLQARFQGSIYHSWCNYRITCENPQRLRDLMNKWKTTA